MYRILRRRRRLFVFVLGTFVLSACSTQQARLQSADALAKTGKAFTESVPVLYDSFFSTAVETDSIDLERQRDTAIRIVAAADASTREAERQKQRADLRKQLDKTNELLGRQLAAVRAAQRHAGALRNYFVGLEAFTSDDSAEQTGDALKGLVGRVTSFSGELKSSAAKLPINLESVAGVAGEYIVLGVKSAKLSAHLEKHGMSIQQALSLQADFIDAIGRNMQSDLGKKSVITLKNPLFADYMTLNGSLPANWSTRRKEFIEHQIGIAALDDAQRAARMLLQSWEQLARGQLSAFTLETLIADVEAAIAIAQRVRADGETKE